MVAMGTAMEEAETRMDTVMVEKVKETRHVSKVR